MKLMLRFVAFSALLAVPAFADVIDFDSGTADTTIGDFYASLGVHFGNGATFVDNFGAPGSSGMLGAGSQNAESPYRLSYDDRIVISFDAPQWAVSVMALDVGFAGVIMNAYDEVGTLVGSVSHYGSTERSEGEFYSLSVSGGAIRSVEIYQPLLAEHLVDGMLIDDLETDPTPEPATCAVVAFGLISMAVGALRRRRRA